MAKPSVALKRRITAFPCERYFCLFKAFFYLKETDSKGVEIILRKFFDEFSPSDQQRLLDYYRKNKLGDKK